MSHSSSWNQQIKFKGILYYGTLLLLLRSVECAGNNEQRNTDSAQKINSLDASCQLNSNSSTTTTLCLTPGCIDAASYLLSSMDRSVDPCEDFYQFSCGGWIKRKIPEGPNDASVLSELDKKIANDLIILLEEEIKGPEADHLRKIREVYNSCMDLRGIKDAGYEPLVRFLESIVQTIRDWNAKDYDWTDTLRLIRKAGYSHNFPLIIDVIRNQIAIFNPEIKFKELLDGSFFNESFDIQNSPQALSNREQMRKIALQINMNTSVAEISNMNAIDGILSLFTWNSLLHPELQVKIKPCLLNAFTPHAFTPHEEIHLQEPADTYAKIRTCLDWLSNKTEIDINKGPFGYEIFVEGLQRMVPQLDWLKYFNALFDDPIKGNDTVWIPNSFMMLSVANFMTGTHKRSILEYYLWHVAKEYDDLFVELTQKEENKGMRCLGYISKYLDIPLGSIYIKRYPKEEETAKVPDIVNYIKNEFVNILENKTWIKSEHKDKVKKKVTGVKVHVGYPEELLDDRVISNMYEDLKIEANYIDNHMRMKKFKTDRKFSRIRKQNNGWEKFARTMDSEITYDLDGMNIPAGRLQSPYFDTNRPQYMNFGALGSAIGHGIAYIFNHKGCHKDKNLEPWWGTDIQQRYIYSFRCIIEQYRNYTEHMGLKPTSNITKDEALADNLGLKLAYLAYLSWVKDHGIEGHLPGLEEYTPKQLFWISATSGMCGKYKRDNLNKEKQTNLWILRVLGSVSNRPEFANDFKCRVGSKMNPEKKCQFW